MLLGLVQQAYTRLIHWYSKDVGLQFFFNASIMKAGMVMFQLVVVYSLSGHPGGDSPGTPDEAGKLLRTVCSCQIHRKGCCSDSAF